MNCILLITTKGCEGCKIQDKLITEALSSITDINIRYEKINVDDVCVNIREYLNYEQIIDFPVTCFIVNNNIKCHVLGTQPKIIIQRLIHKYFS